MRSLLKPKLKSSNDSIAQASAGSDAYEVRCYQCDTSFPVGTKSCLHCGDRLGVPFMMFRPPAGDTLADDGQPGEFFEMGSAPVRPIDLAEEEEIKPRGSSIFRAFGNLSWIVLFVAITAYRQCAG